MNNAKLYVFHTMIFLCEMSGYRGRVTIFLNSNTSEVFIHSLSEGPLCLPDILETTKGTGYHVDYVG